MSTVETQNVVAVRERLKGETFVWVTSMGLALGLAMIAALLGLILINGISVFWPQRIAVIELRDSAPDFHGGRRAIGQIMFEQDRDPRSLAPQQAADEDPAGRREMQLFTGNRDAFGQSFAFLSLDQVESVSYPRGIIRAERKEFGDAVFLPLRLEWPDGRSLNAESPRFAGTLRRLVEEAESRRREINRIERFRIGRINERMRDAQLEERYLLRTPGRSSSEDARLAELQQRLTDLEAEFQPLAAEARALRAVNQEVVLHYELSNGDSRSIPVGEVYSYYYANELTFLQRFGRFLSGGWRFVSRFPREANTEGGIWPAIFGTFVMTVLMSIAVMPFGVVAAIYLREYAKQGFLVRSVRIAVNNLAGVPSIVFGLFGLGFFVHLVGGTIDSLFFSKSLPDPTFKTGGILWASFTLALMTLPVVIVATEEALAAVPRGVREGSLACGASKWQTIWHLVLPASAPGIMTGLILAMARGAGEVAPLILVGVVALAPNLPLDRVFPFLHLERKFMHLGFHIYDLGFQSPDSEAARPMVFATTLVLIAIVVVLNLTAIRIRNRLRRSHDASAF
ncbi:MAG: phosphate ABC transporter permease PstA [Spirochaetaceae bacterium]